jgi:hypothetical protein
MLPPLEDAALYAFLEHAAGLGSKLGPLRVLWPEARVGLVSGSVRNKLFSCRIFFGGHAPSFDPFRTLDAAKESLG